MGGGIGAAVLERYPALFDKAVLSAPMIAPVVGMPTWIARIATGALCGLGFGKARVFRLTTDFSPELDLDEHKGASEARVRWFHKQRVDDVACQTNAATFEWAHQAMALSRAVLKPDMCGAIETPTLLFQAGRDVWVLNGPQDDFVERVREGGGSDRKNTVRQFVARDLLHAEHGGRTVCEQDSRLPQRARGQSVSGTHCKTHAACTVCDRANSEGEGAAVAEKTFERTPKDLIIGIAMTLCGGVLWGVNATVSKILMGTYHASPLWIACVRKLAAGVLSSPARPS